MSSAFSFVEMPDAFEQRSEILAVDELHREKMPSVNLCNVVNPADIRMGQLPRDPHFGEEALPAHGIIGELGRKELQRNRLPQLQIIGAIDFPHSAAAEQPDDAVAVGQDRSGSESSRRNRVGGDYPGNVGRFRRLSELPLQELPSWASVKAR